MVRVRRKGLALLAYVALEGPTRRERLADVLWGHRRALENLRVELHRLRAAFAPLGIDPVARAGDLVSLASAIKVAPITSVAGLLEGLEDVSFEYQAWLEYRRAVAADPSSGEMRGALLEDLARSVAAPFVLVLQGWPGSGRKAVARSLAHRLALPFVEGAQNGAAALRYVAPTATANEELAARIRDDEHSVWVVGCSAIGEEPLLLLRLRAEVAAERMRFEHLGPLPWSEAKRLLPADVGFDEGTRLYLASCGNPGYLTELVALRNQRPLGPVTPIPQKLRAAFALEANRLSPPARHALERLSVYDGTFSKEMIAALGAYDHLDELERTGWLAYDGTSWQMADSLAGRLLNAGLQAAQKRHLETLVADELARQRAASEPGNRRRRASAARAGDGPDTLAPGTPSTAADEAPSIAVQPGRELFLDEAHLEGATVVVEDGRITWSRLPSAPLPGSVAWSLPSERVLLRVRGRAQLMTDPRGTDGTSGGTAADRPVVLRLWLNGSPPADLVFAASGEARMRPGGGVWIPMSDRFDHWFLVEDGGRLRLECAARTAVIEAEVTLFRPLEQRDGGTAAVRAIDLSAAANDDRALAGSDREPTRWVRKAGYPYS